MWANRDRVRILADDREHRPSQHLDRMEPRKLPQLQGHRLDMAREIGHYQNGTTLETSQKREHL